MVTATALKYNIVSNDGEPTSVTVFPATGPHLVATKEHPNFRHICQELEAGNVDEQSVKGMFDVSIALSNKFQRLSERVTLNGGRIFFDGDPVEDVLAQTITRFHAAGDDFMPLVNFMEKIGTNPLGHSREQLFRWLTKHRFSIFPDGDILCYKGVHVAGGLYKSSSSGTAYVNGEVVKGQIPNVPDSIIEMPRSQVHHDPHNGCSTGLHVATYSFARGFATVVVAVKVNPRDVVSIPTDSGDQKMRVCRYRVLEVVKAEITTNLFIQPPDRTAKVVAKKVQEGQNKAEKEKATLDSERRRQEAKIARSRGSRPTHADTPPEPEPEKRPLDAAPGFPVFYEQFTQRDFAKCGVTELRWLAKEWGITGMSRAKADVIVPKLLAEAKSRLATW